MLLLLTSRAFITAADMMVAACEAEGYPYHLLYTEDLPHDVGLSFDPTSLPLEAKFQSNRFTLNLQKVTGVWHYLAELEPDVEGMDEVSAGMVRQELHRAVIGLYLALEDRCWANPPRAETEAWYKLYQLRLASTLGFPIPHTVITNQPDVVMEMLETHSAVMYKPMRRLLLSNATGDPTHVAYATRLTREMVSEGMLESVTVVPCCFQSIVPKAHELTVYVVGNQVFAAEVPGDDGVDSRIGGIVTTPYIPTTLPDPVAQRCRAMTQQMGLQWCNFDLIETPNGEYVFLDANPTDNWVWFENSTGYSISRALVTLFRGDVPRTPSTQALEARVR